MLGRTKRSLLGSFIILHTSLHLARGEQSLSERRLAPPATLRAPVRAEEVGDPLGAAVGGTEEALLAWWA